MSGTTFAHTSVAVQGRHLTPQLEHVVVDISDVDCSTLSRKEGCNYRLVCNCYEQYTW